jgi:2Fe-2S ferredoxin
MCALYVQTVFIFCGRGPSTHWNSPLPTLQRMPTIIVHPAFPGGNMAKVVVTGRDGRQEAIEGEVGYSLMEVIRNGGLEELLAMCGGSCSCATCHVYVGDSFKALTDGLAPMNEYENDLLDTSDHRTAQSRLACQVPFSEALDGLAVTIAPED